MNTSEIGVEIWRRQQQFLVHSFLYYKLDQSVIPDHQYDWLCKRLVDLSTGYPQIAQEYPYYKLCQGIGENGSGYYIQDYPMNIQTTALRVLWQHKKEHIKGFNESFPQFISRWGYKLEGR